MSQSPHSRGTPSRVGEVISDPKNNIGALYGHARVLAKLDSLLSGFAGPELAPNFQVANFHQDRLVLIAPSASWATRLRLQSTGMLGLLHSAGYHQLRHIDVRVSPLQRQKSKTRIRRQSSPAAQEAADLISRLTNPGKG